MRAAITAFVFLTSIIVVRAQNSPLDKVICHRGDTLFVQVAEVTTWLIKYKHPGESVIIYIGKPAVSQIIYASGRVEKVTDYVSINSEADFEKVVLVNSEDEINGLAVKGEVEGKTAAIGYQTVGSSDKASLNRIRKAAAKLKAPYVLLREVTKTGFAINAQTIRKGVACNYK